MKKLLAAVLGYAIILLIVLAVLVPVTFLCGGLMRLLGFTYDSPGSFLLFFVICAVCGFPLEIFSKAFPKAMRTLGLLGARGEKILFLILDAASTTVVMLVGQRPRHRPFHFGGGNRAGLPLAGQPGEKGPSRISAQPQIPFHAVEGDLLIKDCRISRVRRWCRSRRWDDLRPHPKPSRWCRNRRRPRR